MKKPVIAITMKYFPPESTFSNGLFQNIYTLYEMLQATSRYETYIAVDQLPEERSSPVYEFQIPGMQNIRMVKTTTFLKNEVPMPDLIIEAGQGLSTGALEAFRVKKPNIKVAILHYGNIMIDHQENAVLSVKEGADNRTSAFGFRCDRDFVWLSPHYQYFQEYARWHYNAKVVAIAPYVWSSKYLDANVKTSECKVSDQFGRVAVIEPNIHVSKTSIVPIAIIDAASQKSDVIEKGIVFGTSKWLKDKYHVGWIKDRHSYKNKILTFQARYRFPVIFAGANRDIQARFRCGTLLSHQWCNGLNYVYLEALHLDIPLVHNSEYIKEAGYYYEGFDVTVGADMLIKAIETGRGGMTDEYKENAKGVLWKYSPDNPENVEGYIRLIEEALNS